MNLYFEIGEVIKIHNTYDSSNSKIVCQKRCFRSCSDCVFNDEPTYFCDSVGCMGSERPDGEDVLFQEIKEEGGGVK